MKKYIIIALFTCFSAPSLANFNFIGDGKFTYPTGIEKEFQFGFAWNPNTQKFRIGDKSYSMGDLPDSYSIAITLSKDESRVWVQEFNHGFIEAFQWKIGEHTVSLNKKSFKKPVKGDYVLTLNDTDYFFMRNNISIEVSFNTDGIKNIKIDGVTKDMGTKK